MKLKVKIYGKKTADAQDITHVGTITWDGEFHIEPSDVRMNSILALPISANVNGKMQTVKKETNPKFWMQNLCREYSGSYLRASQASQG